MQENTNKMQENRLSFAERLRSKAVWVSVFGALTVLLNAFGLFEKWGIDSVQFDAVTNSVCTVLIAFGILNNPTDREHF